jgi:hypothetical protein
MKARHLPQLQRLQRQLLPLPLPLHPLLSVNAVPAIVDPLDHRVNLDTTVTTVFPASLESQAIVVLLLHLLLN